MDIIERLNDPELYIDAVDDAIREIERLRHVIEMYKIQLKIDWSNLALVAEVAGVEIVKDANMLTSAICAKIKAAYDSDDLDLDYDSGGIVG